MQVQSNKKQKIIPKKLALALGNANFALSSTSCAQSSLTTNSHYNNAKRALVQIITTM